MPQLRSHDGINVGGGVVISMSHDPPFHPCSQEHMHFFSLNVPWRHVWAQIPVRRANKREKRKINIKINI